MQIDQAIGDRPVQRDALVGAQVGGVGRWDVLDRLHVGINPSGVAVNPSTNRIYVGIYDFAAGNSVLVINGATDTPITSIIVGGPPWLIDVNSATNRAYVTLCGPFCGATAVDVIDLVTNTTIAAVPVGNNPYGVAVNAIDNVVFATNRGDDSVSIIDGTSNTVGQTLAVGRAPQGVGFNPTTRSAYVANAGSNSVSVISSPPPPPEFEGTPGMSNCHGKSVAALAHQFGGLNAAAKALGFSSVQALQGAIRAFCGQ